MEYTEERRDGGHVETIIEQGLDAKEKLWGKFGALARRSGVKKAAAPSSRSFLQERLTVMIGTPKAEEI